MSASPTCYCPKCNTQGCEILQHEVDIGVGTQVHVYGFDCLKCGQISVCTHCGQPDFLPHAVWCDMMKDFKS